MNVKDLAWRCNSSTFSASKKILLYKYHELIRSCGLQRRQLISETSKVVSLCKSHYVYYLFSQLTIAF